MDAAFHHNPACGTSRNVLHLLRRHDLEPRVIENLKQALGREEIARLARLADVPLRALLREKGTPFAALRLGDPALSDATLLDAIATHPILLNRPIVVIEERAAVCRPSERVLDLLGA